MKEEAKWDLLDCIQENTEGWENDKGRKSGINYDYECIKTFMGTNDFVILVLFMNLILKLLQTILRPLPLILIFRKRSGTSTMHLINILLIVFLQEILKFILLIM